MFTIKHTRDDFSEALYSATDVRYEPAHGTGPATPAPETVWLRGGDIGGPQQPLTGGTIYVMNDHGATVAKYLLGDGRPVSPVQA